jgi:excinuclease ABC subunit A
VALNVRFRERSIAALAHEPIAAVRKFFTQLKLATREAAIAHDLLAEIRARLQFLERVGLGYLALDRSAPTLSGGEAQRIRLAAQLGSNLRGVCYVLDEPTIGLHPRDNAVLLDALAELALHKNTLVVVEHDEDTIRRADHVVDLGPAAGVKGGEVVGAGTVKDLMANPRSITGQYLRKPLQHSLVPQRAVTARTPCLRIEGATLHNVADADVRIPLGRLVVITGVSGSGKSTIASPRSLARRSRTRRCWDAALCVASNMWIACSRLIRVPSAKRRAPARQPMWDSGMKSAASMPARPRRGSADSPPAASPSTLPGVAAAPAKARACKP